MTELTNNINAAAANMTSLAGIVTSAQDSKAGRAYATAMYNKQKKDQIAWNRYVMDYNSPKSQVERLRQAGLNPYLMYGSGGVTNTSQSAISPTPQPYYSSRVPEALANHASVQMSLARQNAEIQNIEADTKSKEAQTANTQEDTNNKKIINEFLPRRQATEIEQLVTSINLSNKSIEKIDKDIEHVNSQIESIAHQNNLTDTQIEKVKVETWSNKLLTDIKNKEFQSGEFMLKFPESLREQARQMLEYMIHNVKDYVETTDKALTDRDFKTIFQQATTLSKSLNLPQQYCEILADFLLKLFR